MPFTEIVRELLDFTGHLPTLSRALTPALSADTITAEMPIAFLLGGNPASEAVSMAVAAGTGDLAL
jgi:hypothetical protein